MTMFGMFPERRFAASSRRRHDSSRRSACRAVVERLEPRALLAVTIPPSISASVVEIDDNLVIGDGSWSVTATDTTAGHVQIFGNSRGRIDGTAGQSNEDLLLSAQTSVTVTGAIGSSQTIDDLTLTSALAQPVTLQQSVSLSGDLRVTKAGTFNIGSTATIDGDLVIDAATTVLFAGNVTVGGNLTITQASSVTFAGTLTVGGTLTIADVSGATRFAGDVSVGSASVTSTANLQVQSGFTTTAGDVSFTANKVNLSTATLSGMPAATLAIRPRDASRAIAIGSPPGIASGLSITDADLAAIQSGWMRVVLGDEAAGTGAVRVGSIGSQYGGYSQLLNTTTIVGGSIVVEQPVDTTSLAAYLELNARTGGITIDAAINQTAEESNDWVRLRAAGAIAINKPIHAVQTVSLITTAGGTIAQVGGAAGGSAISTTDLLVDADGTVTLADGGNALTRIAIKTTNDGVALREDSGYEIGEISTTDSARSGVLTATVTGIEAGSGTVRLVTNGSTVTQTKRINAAELGLEGTGGVWTLSLSENDIDRLAADTGAVTFRDADDLTIGSVTALAPQAALAGIRATGAVSVTAATSVSVKQAVDGGSTVDLKGTATTVTVEAAIKAAGAVTVDAGTVLTLSAAGDVTSDKASSTAVTLRGANGISTAGDVTTLGGDVVFENAATLTGDVAISTASGGSVGAVRFKGTLEGTTAGAESLSITGNLVTLASVGATTALESLSVSGTSDLAGGTTLRTVGGQTYTGAATSAGAVTVRAGTGAAVKVLGDATLGGLVTTGEAYDVALTGTTVAITDLVTFLNTGSVTLGDGAGDSLTFNGGLTSTAPSLTRLAGTIATSDDPATFGKVFLDAATTVSTGTAGTTFSGTLDGGQTLAVNTSGTTTFGGAVGGTTALTSLTTDKGGTTAINGGTVKTSGADGQVYNDAVTLGANTVLDAAAGAITFATTLDGVYRLDANTTGTTTFNGAVGSKLALTHLETNNGGTTAINGGSVTTDSADSQVYNDAVTLGANTLLDAGNGGITFATTLDGAFTLNANTTGTTTFNGALGGTTALVSLSTNKGGTTAINGGSVKTSGSDGQVYSDAVTLGANTVLDAAAGAITFATTLDGAFTFAANTAGATTFNGAVGGTTALTSLATNKGGTTAINGGSVKTSGADGHVYNDAVTLGENTTLDAAAGAITFATTLDGAFTFHANTIGTTTLGGAVGGTTALVSLTTNKGGTTAINGGSVKTSGSDGQVYNDAVTLGANTVLDATAGAITFATTLDGAFTLNANTTGATTFNGAVGGTTALTSLSTSKGGTTAINGGSVKTSGSDGQVYNDAVTLGANTTLDAAAGAITFATTLDGAFTLNANTTGATTFNDAVGGTTALVSLTTNKGGTTAINGGSVKTSGADGQVYNDAVTLGANTTLDAAAGAITFATTLDGAYTFAANTTGATTFNGAVGGTTALVSLSTNKGGTTAINGGSVKTSGSDGQVYNDAVTLGANTTLDAAAGAITFATTLNGAFTFAANTTGATTFNGAVGGTTALVSLTTNKGGTTAINGGSVTTSGADGQVYNDAVVLGANTTLDAATGAITFATTLDGAFTFAANTTGTTTFGGVVGSTTPLAHLETNVGGTTAINGGAITTDSPTSQVYNDAVTLGANTVLDAGNGGITFASTLDGAFTLDANTTGTTTFSGAVGGTTALVSLSTNAGGSTAINGGSVKTSGVQQYNDPVTLGANTSFAGVGVVFGTTLQGSAKTLSIVAGATGVSFGGNVGTVPEPLGAIDVGSVGVVTISGDIFSTGPVVIRSSGSGITMADGAVVDAGAGTILLAAAGDVALGGLVTTNATSDAVKITSTAGAITDGGDTDTDIVAAASGAVVTLKAATGIGMSNALEINASSVEAMTMGGGIGLAALSDLSIGVGGLSAPGVISLSAEGAILVPTGGRIAGGSVVASDPIQWSVLNTADSGVGSLRQVITNANATGVEGVAVFTTKTATFAPATPLPTLTTKFTLDGTGRSIVLDGGSKVATGLALAAGSAGSTVRGLAIRGFTGTGIVLDASRGSAVSGCLIQANANGLSATGNLAGATVAGNTFDRNRLYGIQLMAARGLSVDGNTVTGVNSAVSMGLYATGDLAGTTITANTFTAGLRGALLDSARNLVFGQAGRGNSLLNNRSAPGTAFAGTGIRAQGNLAGTTVRANTFAGNNYGMAFINARNIVFGGRAPADRNTINSSSIAAVFVEGNNAGSAQTGTVFGTGARANAKAIKRVKGSTGL
jgi:hypothetical protein